MNDENYSACEIDLYQGAYGRTLRVAISNPEILQKITTVFQTLVDGNSKKINLKQERWVICYGLNSLLLTSAEEIMGGKNVFYKQTDGSVEIEWKGPFSYWLWCKEMLEGFELGKKSHHYLSKEGRDDVLIEVSYLGG